MRSLWLILSRAVFLASSWTWVIGMFFPVLLVKDFGAWSFVPFAVCNVLGAMSVGVLLSARQAQASYDKDLVARAVFSSATIALHVFFITAIAGRHLPSILEFLPEMGGENRKPVDPLEASAVMVIFMLIVPYAIARKERPPWVRMVMAIGVFALSIACAALAYATTSGAGLALPPMEGVFERSDLAFASMGIAFGFALCPYLDQSIVRIRAVTPGTRGRLASVLGFGVFFFAMILFTWLYAQAFLGRVDFSYYILLHILGQSMFTTGVHMGELRRMSDRHERVPRRLLFWSTLGACFIAAGLGVFTFLDIDLVRNRSEFELVYQGFLSLYGVVFPLYVWAVMVPFPGLRTRPRRARLAGFWVALALSSGVFGYGYLAHEWWLVGVGVVVALAVPLVVCAAMGGKGSARASTGV